MSDQTILGSEFTVWMQARTGDTCPMCGGEIEYTPLGMADGQSQHRVECDCTVIECRAASEVNDS